MIGARNENRRFADARLRIREHLTRQFRGSEFTDSDDIFEVGLINSLAAVELVLYLEKTFDILVEEEDLEMKNFRSVDGMVAFLQRKCS